MTDTPLDLDYIEHRMASPMVTYRENVEEDVPALVAALRDAEAQVAEAARAARISSDALARSKRECDGTSALAGEALERALVAEARLVEATAQIKRLAAERDASRTAHAALVADLREAEVEWHDAWSSVALDDNEAPVLRQVALAWLSARAILRTLLAHHAPTTGATAERTQAESAAQDVSEARRRAGAAAHFPVGGES